MKIPSLQPFLKRRPSAFAIALFLSLAFMLTAFASGTCAQGNQLSLADILIGLRSKKLTLPERNKILADAVATRGTTFSLSQDIEKELSETGADKGLIDSIRKRGQIVKVAAVVPSQPAETKPKVEPKVEPPPPDFSFYEKRADASSLKGDLDAALTDYTKAIEMNGSSITALAGRGSTHFAKGSFAPALADYTKAIELSPKNAFLYFHRGEVYEKKGDLELAAADYKKALEVDPANESAKLAASRVEAAQAKLLPKVEPAPAKPTVTAAPLPEFLYLGTLSESTAIKMVKPVYSQTAIKLNIGGKVSVDVELDTKGNVTSAKASNGSPYLRKDSEIAAMACKFKPAMVGDQPVKGKGIITYNFVPPTR